MYEERGEGPSSALVLKISMYSCPCGFEEDPPRGSFPCISTIHAMGFSCIVLSVSLTTAKCGQLAVVNQATIEGPRSILLRVIIKEGNQYNDNTSISFFKCGSVNNLCDSLVIKSIRAVFAFR